MIPSLFTSSIILSLALIFLGGAFFLNSGKWQEWVKSFPRSYPFAIITLGLGGLWFLWKIAHLPQSDFGDYKEWIFGLFLLTLIGSLLYVKDFLAVRGLAVLVLLLANTGLKSAYGLYDIPERLIFVTILYVLIVGALYYGTIPYKMRETVNWLYANPSRARVLGFISGLMGVSCLVGSFMY